nr:RNA-directed DNA polymerase, eukaryota, reverse transcriptase zinc-binding domain protein [Tanacetum cinerariifolium]
MDQDARYGDCQRFNAIYKHLIRKSEENDADLVENAKTSYLERCGKKIQYPHVWNILKNYPKWNAAEPIDEDNLEELFGPDPRERPAGKQRASKKQKSVDTSSAEGSTGGSTGGSQSESVSRGFRCYGHRRREVVRLIQEVEKVDAMEVAQKAKIKWSIEGDENSKYYHGVLNKKRGRLTIRGVLVDERDFVKRISLEQNDDLEREVSNEEIKRAVWDCGIDKASGPDGFTFGFYRQYWDIIGNDVVDVVKWFFFFFAWRDPERR